MKELSLSSGAGGGLLGTKLLKWECIGYVENNKYCQKVIAQRIKDGFLDRAPIFSDVRIFISEGFACSYKGMVDVLTAGFPCQPFSITGKRKGEQDERNMWPATIATIRIIRPSFCLLENVPNLLNNEYFGKILGDLAESGYYAKWKVLSASEVGATHKRDRLFIMAYSDSKFIRLHTRKLQNEARKAQQKAEENHISSCKSKSRGEQTQWWDIEPGMDRMVDGFPNRVDRFKAIGNGQVPEVVRVVWKLLNNFD